MEENGKNHHTTTTIYTHDYCSYTPALAAVESSPSTVQVLPPTSVLLFPTVISITRSSSSSCHTADIHSGVVSYRQHITTERGLFTVIFTLPLNCSFHVATYMYACIDKHSTDGQGIYSVQAPTHSTVSQLTNCLIHILYTTLLVLYVHTHNRSISWILARL